MYQEYECCGDKDHHPNIIRQPPPYGPVYSLMGQSSEGRDLSSISKSYQCSYA